MHEPVEDGGGDDGVAEDVAPFGEASVGGDEGGVAAFVAGVDDVEERGGAALVHGEQSDVVDDEDGGGGVGLELRGPGARAPEVAEVGLLSPCKLQRSRRSPPEFRVTGSCQR